MPTFEQIEELLANCNYKWVTQNGVKGGKFTSKLNGNSIFLPAAGYRHGSGLNDACSDGYYWSSMQEPSNTDSAYYLYFGSDYTGRGRSNRGNGQSVRPVVGI